MEARSFDFELDYPDVYKWWSDWGMNPILPDYLPSNGIMIENNNEKLCCGFIYMTDSDYCIISWILRNKKAKKENRINCMNFLIKNLIEKVKEMGYKACRLEIDIKEENMLKKFDKFGFVREDNVQITTLLING